MRSRPRAQYVEFETTATKTCSRLEVASRDDANPAAVAYAFPQSTPTALTPLPPPETLERYQSAKTPACDVFKQFPILYWYDVVSHEVRRLNRLAGGEALACVIARVRAGSYFITWQTSQ